MRADLRRHEQPVESPVAVQRCEPGIHGDVLGLAGVLLESLAEPVEGRRLLVPEDRDDATTASLWSGFARAG